MPEEKERQSVGQAIEVLMGNTMMGPILIAAMVGGGFGFGSGSIAGSRYQDPGYWERIEQTIDKMSFKIDNLAEMASTTHHAFESRLDALERCRNTLKAKGILAPES